MWLNRVHSVIVFSEEEKKLHRLYVALPSHLLGLSSPQQHWPQVGSSHLARQRPWWEWMDDALT